MQKITFDLDVLRTFVSGIELGSFAKAADRLGRSTSAVSAQLKKLEEQVEIPILRKSGRGMEPTAAGEILLGYARRLLELNDEAAIAVRGVDLAGCVRLGLQEDFGERLLTEVLGRFVRAHPQVQVEAKVTRNTALLEQIGTGHLDLALAWDAGDRTPHSQPLGRMPMRWIGAQGATPIMPAINGEPLPLVVFEAPCLLRSAATAALDRAGISWRLAFVGHSLGGIWAAVAAGLGITVRTEIGLPGNLCILEPVVAGLPALPALGLTLHRSDAELSVSAQRLREIIIQSLEHELPMLAVGH